MKMTSFVILLVTIIFFNFSCSDRDKNTSSDGIADIDGNVYDTVTIGTQVWLVQNMKTTRYRNGTAIPNVKDATQWSNLASGAYCNYDNDPGNATTYGRLYNWYALNDSRNIAPLGWHVATDAEWTTLTTYLGGEDVAGNKLRDTTIGQWSRPSEGATNESGFTALPGGNRYYGGNFNYVGNSGYWWSATEFFVQAWARYISYSDSNVTRIRESKTLGFSVRCVKD